MTRLVWMVVLAACGGTAELHYDLKTKDTAETGPATFEDVADLKPSTDVTGPPGEYGDFIRSAVVNQNEPAKVKLVVGGNVPTGNSGHLDVTLAFDVLWWELPNTTKAHATVTISIDYKHTSPADVGKQVGEMAKHYLDSRRPKHPAIPVLAGPATAVAVGKTIACSLHGDGSVHCWGFQVDPIVGPVPSKTTIAKAVEIAASDGQVCARLEGGEVKCLGSHQADEKKHAVASVCGLDKPTKLALGSHTGCAIVEAGKVRCWNTDVLDSKEPKCGHASTEIAGVANATAISVGFGNACALAAGKAMCWPEGETKATATKLPAGVDVFVGFSPCVVNAAGKITCEKDNDLVPTLPPGSRIAADMLYGCAITPTAQQVCWGKSTFGLFGDGSKDTKDPVPVLDNVISASMAISGTCSVTKDGAVLCFGNNANGAPTGLPATTNKFTKLAIY